MLKHIHGTLVVTDRFKVDKQDLYDGFEVGDRVPTEIEGVSAEIITSDEFDIPPTWIVEVRVHLRDIDSD
jgi:hypothetical protein